MHVQPAHLLYDGYCVPGHKVTSVAQREREETLAGQEIPNVLHIHPGLTHVG